MKVTIKGKEIELRQSVRALMMYENITEKTFRPDGLEEIMTLMYCIVVCVTKDYSLTFDEFLDEVDNDVTVVNEFMSWLLSESDNQNKLKKE